MTSDKLQLKRASTSALLSLLNLTILPIVGFVALLFLYQKTEPSNIDRYYVAVGIKTNLWAAVALILVTGIIFLVGGYNSAWTWVYVASYFVIVHALFILFATWTLTRSWTGQKLKLSLVK